MDVVRHELHIVAMNIVVQAAPDRANIVVRDLPGIEALVFRHDLKLLGNNKVTALNVIAIGPKLRESGRSSRFVALAKILPDQIEAPPVKRTVQAVSFPLRRA